MKKLLVFLVWLLLAQMACAQIYVGGILVDSSKAEKYLLARPQEKKKQVSFSIQCAGCKEDMKLTTAQGEPLIFDSLAAGLDFFYRQGWEVCTAVANASGFSDGPVDTKTTYLLQRRK